MNTLGRMAEAAPTFLPGSLLLSRLVPLLLLLWILISVFFYFFIQYDNLCLIIRQLIKFTVIILIDIFAIFLVLSIVPFFFLLFLSLVFFFPFPPSLYCALLGICFSHLFSFTPLLIWKFCPLFICVLSNLSVYLTEFKVTGVLSLPYSTRILDANHAIPQYMLVTRVLFLF